MPSNACTIPNRKRSEYSRSESTIKRLKMQRETTIRNEEGKIVFERYHNDKPELDGRIAPNRKWFGNTRVVGQQELDKMREIIDKESKPNQFLLRSQKLPTQLIRDLEPEQIRIDQLEPFEQVFGKKATRKKAKLNTYDSEELAKVAQQENKQYDTKKDSNTIENKELQNQPKVMDPKLTRGATQRVYAEIYKVIDSSDVICYVLDAREPEDTRSHHVEQYMSLPENEHRHLIYILNKVDLVPIWVTKSWIQQLSQVHPTIAFNASARKPFGRAELISVLRQFSHMHKDRPNISVGFLGFPNVGKSSVINALINKESCKVAPIPGETKVWQYVNLTKKIFLIDAPGVVFPGLSYKMFDKKLENIVKEKEIAEDSYGKDLKLILLGVIRIENIEYPEQIVPEVLKKVEHQHVCRTYLLKSFKDSEDLLEQLARKQGRLLQGGEVDKRSVARRLLEDYVRGHIPHFTAPHDEKEIIDYKNSIKAEREKWLHQTDSELIKFINKQKLLSMNQEFKYLNQEGEAVQHKQDYETEKQNQDKDQKEDVDNQLEEQEEQEENNIQNDDELVQSIKSDDIDDAFDDVDEKSKSKSSKQKFDVDELLQQQPSLIMKHKKRMKYKEGIQRATRLLSTKNAELRKVASSTLVDEQDLKRVVRDKKVKSKKQRQGGASHEKTGQHFYAVKKIERGSAKMGAKKGK